jgi:hypothetical protein
MLYLVRALHYVAIVNPSVYVQITRECLLEPPQAPPGVGGVTSKERVAGNWDVCKDGKLPVPLEELQAYWNKRKCVAWR